MIYVTLIKHTTYHSSLQSPMRGTGGSLLSDLEMVVPMRNASLFGFKLTSVILTCFTTLLA